jgi:hypothetical protein
MRLQKLAGALLSLALAGASQDLAPDLLLARLKSHMGEERSNLPNYTCVETFDRFQRDLGPSLNSREPLKPLDRVGLEIVYTDGREWYGSPGEGSLRADNPAGLVGSGLIGTGAFALTLNHIMDDAVFTYRGEESLAGRKAVKFDFHYDRELHGFKIGLAGGEGWIGQNGSIWVDPELVELISLESSADDIPGYLPLLEQRTKVNYARMQIGSYHALLAQQATFQLLETSGRENYDQVEFTHCRAFAAQSVLRFDAELEQTLTEAPAALPVPRASHAIPALLPVTVQLATPVTNHDAVGRQIEGEVVGDVVRNGKTVISSGARVHGRIRRLEHYSRRGRESFIVGLEFTEVEAGGDSTPFFADLLRLERRPEIQVLLSERVFVLHRGGYHAADATVTLPELPGVASFFVSGATFVLPRGFRTFWRTRGPMHLMGLRYAK